ncbi:MAG: YitT family protein [Tissierellia bacterium]|nr:YitT family protein [Tissierellia bacterium]
MKTNKINKIAKRVLLIALGALMMSIGTYFFLFGAKIASGGVGGVAFIISEMFPSVQVGIVTTILNAVLFIIGFIVLGPEFGIYTISGTAIYSFLLIIYDKYFKDTGMILKDPITNIMVGAGLTGLGLSLVFSANASTGGTDIIAKILDKYFSIGMGTGIMLADSLIIIAAAFVLGIEKAIYGILTLIITSLVINKVLTGFNTLIQMTVISTHIDEINEYITKELNRGTTLYKARGGYTGNDKEILMTIVGRNQYLKIKNKINKIDDQAFVFINSTSEVIGEGFTREAAQ